MHAYLTLHRRRFVFFSPYLSADLRLMASCFNTSVADLEDELMILILDGQIQARIDSHNKVGVHENIICSRDRMEK